MATQNIMKDLGGYMTDAQFIKLYNSIDKPRDKILIRVLMISGRRISEIVGRRNPLKNKEKEYKPFVGLRPMDIKFDENVIIFNILKKRKPKMLRVGVDKETILILNRFIKDNKIPPDKPIFDITRQAAFKIVRKVCEQAGIYYIGHKRPHPHHFRHSAAISTLRNAEGATGLVMVKKLLDHTSLDMTEHYLQFSQEDMIKLQNKRFKKLLEGEEDG